MLHFCICTPNYMALYSLISGLKHLDRNLFINSCRHLQDFHASVTEPWSGNQRVHLWDIDHELDPTRTGLMTWITGHVLAVEHAIQFVTVSEGKSPLFRNEYRNPSWVIVKQGNHLPGLLLEWQQLYNFRILAINNFYGLLRINMDTLIFFKSI